MHPDDMDLQTELKNLGAQQTMSAGNYGSARSFRESVRDMAKQSRLLALDTDVRSMDVMTQQILEAEAEWRADPNESGKLTKLVDILLKTELPEQENRAIELLESEFERTRQYRFRFRIGQIRLAQLSRMERSLRADMSKNPTDESIKNEYRDFARDRAEQELTFFHRGR